MLGIGRTHRLTAENLDIRGADVEGLMEQARRQTVELARSLL